MAMTSSLEYAQSPGLVYKAAYIVGIKLILSLLSKLLYRSLCHKHANAPFLINNVLVHKKIDPLEGSSRIDLIVYGKFSDRWNLGLFRKSPGEDTVPRFPLRSG